jgi:hypothetical protein
MIDTREQTAVCLACGRPLTQKSGHRKRLYCTDACRQRGHRKHQAPQPVSTVTNVTIEEQESLLHRIAQLERENATLRALRGTRSSSDAKKLRQRYIERAMAWGEKLDYRGVTVELYTGEGLAAWEAYMKEANEKLLIRLIIAAERAYEKSKTIVTNRDVEKG